MLVRTPSWPLTAMLSQIESIFIINFYKKKVAVANKTLFVIYYAPLSVFFGPSPNRFLKIMRNDRISTAVNNIKPLSSRVGTKAMVPKDAPAESA